MEFAAPTCGLAVFAIVLSGCSLPKDQIPGSHLPPGVAQLSRPRECPRVVPPDQDQSPTPTDDNPYFTFGTNSTFASDFACEQSGPVRWPANSTDPVDNWFIQDVDGLIAACRNDATKMCRKHVLRMCSHSAEHMDKDEFRPGPCSTGDGAGTGGCEVCLDDETVIGA